MNETVRIQAEVLQHDRNGCRFTVDRPIFRDGFIRFQTAQDAELSPLAKRLFAIPGITSVMFQGQNVTLGKQPILEWRSLGAQVGQAIRAHLAAGELAVAPEALANRSVEDSLRTKVQRVIDEQINPAVASHGGVITLLDVKGSTIFIQMGGGCQGCGQANVTLRDGIEETLRQQVPEVTEILDVTQHAEGRNPYYAAH